MARSSTQAPEKGEQVIDLKTKIKRVPEFKGVVFWDITPLLKDRQAFRQCIKGLADHFRDEHIDVVVSNEARGFIIGAPVAHELNVGFVPIRKKGKLPCKTECVSYGLEYGTDEIEMHQDTIPHGAKVLMVDDLLATGGTMQAACQLVEKAGGRVVGITCLIELTALKGRERLSPYPVHTVIAY